MGRPGKFSKQAAFWRRLSELMVNARVSWCNSTGSKSKQLDNVLIQIWNLILLNLILFSHLVAPAERFFNGCYWDPTPHRRVPWGYLLPCSLNCQVLGIILSMGSSNERQRYNVKSFLIGGAHAQNEIHIAFLINHAPLISTMFLQLLNICMCVCFCVYMRTNV